MEATRHDSRSTAAAVALALAGCAGLSLALSHATRFGGPGTDAVVGLSWVVTTPGREDPARREEPTWST